MAKVDEAPKDKLVDIFKKTEGSIDTADLDRGNIRSTGVGLREGEIDAVDAIGQKLGDILDTEAVARNALLRLAARRLIESVLSGDMPITELVKYFEKPEKPRAKLDL